MSKIGTWLIAALSLFPAASFAQSVSDPFTMYGGLVLGGRIQRMVASREYLIVHRVIASGQQVVECFAEGQLTLSWRKTYVSVGPDIVLEGDRVAFTASETEPTSRSVGFHILDARTGAPIAYTRSGLIGHAGRFAVVSGDHVLDLADGSTVFGHVYDSRHVRFLATVGDKFLLLVSLASDWNERRPVLYDPATRTDLWAGRAIAPEVTEFLDRRLGQATRGGYDGFPVLLAEDVQSRFGPVFKFMLLKEDGGAVFLDRADFGLSEPKPFATVGFSHLWNSPGGPRLVAGINSRHMGKTDGEKIVIAVFDPAGAKLAQAVVDPRAERLSFIGLDPAGRLLAFARAATSRFKDRIVSFALPSLVRTETECAFKTMTSYVPGRVGDELYFWDQEPIFPPGTKIPPRAKSRRPVVAGVSPVTGLPTSYYPLDDSVWDLMSFARDRIGDVFNENHMFLPFRSADRTRNASLILPLQRSNRGWLNASFSVFPEPVFTDADETIAYTPAGASVSISTGVLDGLRWRSPSNPDTTWATVSWGGLSQMFNIPVRARPVNRPPVAKFIVPPRAESSLWDVAVTFDASASTDPDGRIVSYGWRFDDYQLRTYTATGPVFTHEFSDFGTKKVTLTVTDDKGATGSVTRTVFIPKPLDYGGSKRGGPVSVGLAKQAGYDIEITTGNADGAGTDAGVYVALFGGLNADGERLGTGEFHLYDTIGESNTDAFEKGRTDVFKSHQGLRAGLPDSTCLDEIEFITIRHDNAKNKPEWYVKSVTIRNQVNKMEWRFEPEVWLDWNKPPLRSVMGKFLPLPGEYPRGILFGGAQRSWKMTEASDSVFILESGVDKFYFTSLDRSDQIEVFPDGLPNGWQYARGIGLATAPYIPQVEWGVEYAAVDIAKPTRFSVRTTHPDSSTEEATVWVFPSGWGAYQKEALQAALVYPLKGSTAFFTYGDTVRQFMSDAYTWESSLDAALSIVVNYGAAALGIFGGPGDEALKGTIEERVGIYVAKGLNGVLKALGLTLANSIFSETIGLFESMTKAVAWGRQLGSVGASAAAAAGGLQYLGRLASCDQGLLAVTRMLAVIKAKIDMAMNAIDRNDPAGYGSIMSAIRMIALGRNPDSVLPADYLIDYEAYGISDPNIVNGNPTPADNYCLSLWCILELNNIQRWKTGDVIGPCFPSDPLIPWTDAEKKDETQAAMGTYEPLFKNIMMVAGVAISIALLY